MKINSNDVFALVMQCGFTAFAIHGIANGNWVWVGVLPITFT